MGARPAGIPHAVIADSGRGSLMARGEVDASSPAPTGSPRTATPRTRSARTRSPSLPHTTAPAVRRCADLDGRPGAASGEEIPIEERAGAEVTGRFAARNPAFDVTPAELIAAIVTEAGVHRAPYVESLPAASRR